MNSESLLGILISVFILLLVSYGVFHLLQFIAECKLKDQGVQNIKDRLWWYVKRIEGKK